MMASAEQLPILHRTPFTSLRGKLNVLSVTCASCDEDDREEAIHEPTHAALIEWIEPTLVCVQPATPQTRYEPGDGAHYEFDAPDRIEITARGPRDDWPDVIGVGDDRYNASYRRIASVMTCATYERRSG